MGVIYAYLTGEYVTEESAANGDAESRGWVDPSWSMRELFDSRNDVRPVIKVWEDHKDLPDALPSTADDDFADEVRAALALLGAYEDNGDGTFYAVDAQVWDYADPGHYMYALHFTVKRGDTEVSWHPSEAGIEV